jgi:hypothetical protein
MITTITTDYTKLTAGCGHTTIVRLSLDAERAANEIIPAHDRRLRHMCKSRSSVHSRHLLG